MKISFKKVNKGLFIFQILALVIMLFMASKGMKMLFTLLTGANAL
jgi:hypothetical protein